MFSKKVKISFVSILGFSLVLALLSGCDSWLRKKSDLKDPRDAIQIKTKEVTCLKQFPDQLKNYLNDQIEIAMIHSMTDCIQSALIGFQKNTRGSVEGEYQSTELRNFFNRYFLKENKISEEFLTEIMKLKTLFIGGSVSRLTTAEFEKLKEYLEIIRNIALDLKGRWRMLLFKNEGAAFSLEELRATQSLLQKSLRAFFKSAQVQTSPYEWADIKNFLVQLDLFLGGSATFETMSKWLPFVEAIKFTFLGDRIINPNLTDWYQQIDWAGEGFFFSLEYFYFRKNSKFVVIKDYNDLFDFIEHFLRLIEASPQMAKFQYISLTSINHLIDEAYNLKLIKTDLSADLFKSVFQKILWSFVEGKQAQSPGELVNLEMRHLRFIKNEYQSWRMIQTVYSDVLKSQNKPMLYSEFEKALIPYPIDDLINSKNLSLTARSEFLRVWGDTLQLMTQVKHPLIWNADTHLIRDRNWKSQSVDYGGLTLSNSLKTFTRLVLRGYGQGSKSDLWSAKVSEESLVSLEEDFRDFGRAIGFLDYRQKNPARRTYKEANYFPILATSDSSLDPLEIYEMIHLLASGGRFISVPFMDTMAGENDDQGRRCTLDELDPFQKKIVYVNCFKASFYRHFPEVLSGLPNMVTYLKGLKVPQFAGFLDDLLIISKSPIQKEDLLDTGDLRTAVTLLHYAENLMILYDENHDDFLDPYELYKASERFKSLIRLSDEQQKYWKEGFTYLVLTGKMPTGNDSGLRSKIIKIKTTGFFHSIGDWFAELFRTKKDVSDAAIQKQVNELWDSQKADRAKILKTMIVLKAYVQ